MEIRSVNSPQYGVRNIQERNSILVSQNSPLKSVWIELIKNVMFPAAARLQEL